MATPRKVELRDYDLWKSERLRRFRIVMFVSPGLVGLVLMLTRLVFREYVYADRYSVFNNLTGPTVILPLFMMSAVAFLMFYLQTGFRKQTQSESVLLKYESQISELFNLRSQFLHMEEARVSEIEMLKKELSLIASKIQKTPEIMSEDQKQNLIAHLKAEFTAATASKVLDEIKEEASRRFATKEWGVQVLAQFEDSVRRLNNEVAAQGRRGNLNLALGIATTVSGLALLGYFVVKLSPSDTQTGYFDLMEYFIPRLSLILFIELFAYFFLRLYKASLAEIKYFQNELTNVESKAIALRAALNTEKNETISHTIRSLANTERNKILQKGETTAELERAKIEASSISDIAKEVAAVIKKHNQ